MLFRSRYLLMHKLFSQYALKIKTYNNKPKTIKKMVTGTYISIITLNKNGLNAPTKRQRLAEWIQKKRPVYMLSTRDPLQT